MEQYFHIGVKAIFLNGRKEILILKKNPGHGTGGGYWDIPGGRIEKGCGIEDTLKREIGEELGITDFRIIRLFDNCVSNIIPHSGEHGLFLASYICTLDPKNPIGLDSEHTEYKWASISEVKELLKIKYPKSFLGKLDDLAIS